MAARKKTTRGTRAATALRGATQVHRERDEAVADAVDGVRSEMGATPAYVQVWRIRPDGQRAYIRQVSSEEYSMDHLRDSFGAGRYMVRIFAAGEREPIEEHDVRIDGDEPQPQLQAGSSGGVRLGGGRDRSAGELAPADLRSIIRDVLRDEMPPRENMGLELARVMNDNMRTLLPLLTARNGGGNDELMSIVVRALLSKEQHSPDYFALLDKAMEFVERKTGGGSGGDGDGNEMIALAREFGRPLVDLLARSRSGAVKALPQGAVASGAPEQQPETPAMLPTEYQPAKKTPFAMLAPFMVELIDVADQSAAMDDVDLWAATYESALSDGVDMVVNMVARVGLERTMNSWRDTFPALLRNHPQAEIRAAFLGALVGKLVELAESDESAEPA